MNGLHDTPAMKDSAKYADFEYTMAIIPPNFGTHVILKPHAVFFCCLPTPHMLESAR